MTSGWQTTNLDSLVRFRNGKSIKPGGSGTYPVYGSNGTIGASNDYMYEDAIILGRVGAYCGSVERCSGKFWASDNTIVVEANDDEVSLRFLYYMLIDANLNRHAGGAAQPLLTQSRLKPLEFSVPTLATQCRIASILSAYDDLIENNTRRIAILEDMARRLYEEWFVHFRFPGHEDATFAKTNHGPLPEGWAYRELGEVSAFISRGIAPKYDDEAECRVINQKCIRDHRLNMALSRRQSKRVPAEKIVQLHDVLINSTGVGTLGRVAQVQEQLEDVTVDSHITIARANDTVVRDFYGQQLHHLQPYFEEQGVGATGQTELSRTRVTGTRFLLPPHNLQVSFGELVRPMNRRIQVLTTAIANLRAQRDLVLPKLISGEIDVSQSEQELAKAVA